MHTNTMKLRLTGLLAPVAIALTLSSPVAMSIDQPALHLESLKRGPVLQEIYRHV
jgi:hypothetical protein